MPRAAPEEELQYRQWTIPRGTPVMESAFFIHLDPEIFPDPFEFRPERWIDNPSLTQYLVVFGRGTRACLGLNLAMSELNLGIATSLRRFRFELFETSREKEVDVKHIVGLSFPDKEAVGIRVKIVEEYID